MEVLPDVLFVFDDAKRFRQKFQDVSRTHVAIGKISDQEKDPIIGWRGEIGERLDGTMEKLRGQDGFRRVFAYELPTGLMPCGPRVICIAKGVGDGSAAVNAFTDEFVWVPEQSRDHSLNDFLNECQFGLLEIWKRYEYRKIQEKRPFVKGRLSQFTLIGTFEQPVLRPSSA
jgi:hypothetical protein